MNLKQMLADSVEKRGDAVAFRYKSGGEWQTCSYRAFLDHVRTVSELLGQLRVRPGERVGLFADNTMPWAAIYFGIVGTGAIAVPIDAKVQEMELVHILSDSQARVLFCGARQYHLVRERHHQLRDLEHVFIMEGEQGLDLSSSKAPVTYHDLDFAMNEAAADALSEKAAYDHYDPGDDDVASLIYTSGTTGRQKGAMLTHGNFTSNVASCRRAWPINGDDNFLLVLPMHHAFAFTGNLLLPLACGASISLVESLRTVGENIRDVSPTAFIGVPLLIEKMYERIFAKLRQNRPAWLLWSLGLRAPIRHRIRAQLGGMLRLVVTGGAPCDPDILRGYQALGVTIVEGYGLTEASPVLTLNPPDRPKPGTIGRPLSGVEIRIVEANEQGVGELIARGPNIMKGYFHNPEASADVLRDGWLYTGDLGWIDEEGYITLAGRKKSLIVNREGKNIYPEEVEAQVLKSPYLIEALVLGYQEPTDKVGERVGLIVVPNQEQFDQEARRRGRAFTDTELMTRVRDEVRRVTRDLSEYKRPRKVQIRMEEFEKTSTSKIKRYLYEMDSATVD